MLHQMVWLLVRYRVILEEPYDERVTYGSVGVVARKGGLYQEI
ncbi:MAG: hypothetical protein ACI93R_003707 [Flavobacteriales bacterium]|jgi:hypothetical protein